MVYRRRSDFDRPTVEGVERWRRTFAWILPLLFLQQGFTIFGHHSDGVGPLLGTIGWSIISLTILWMLLGLPMGGLSERDQAILDDEWNGFARGEAARWGIAALVLIGCSMMVARLWVSLDAGVAIYMLVNGSLFVAFARYSWLYRGEPDESE